MFARLPQMDVGPVVKVVEVVDAAGGVERFAVDRVEQFPKTRFPTDASYLPRCALSCGSTTGPPGTALTTLTT